LVERSELVLAAVAAATFVGVPAVAEAADVAEGSVPAPARATVVIAEGLGATASEEEELRRQIDLASASAATASVLGDAAMAEVSSYDTIDAVPSAYDIAGGAVMADAAHSAATSESAITDLGYE
jgi:hypothetical protein